jgi:hypothetical protein
MRLDCKSLLISASLVTLFGCGTDEKLGDITISLCSELHSSTDRVELIVARPEGFAGVLPSGASLENVDNQGPDELVWQVPEPEGGWSEDVLLHVDQVSGSEEVAARVFYNASEVAVSGQRAITKGLVLSVCVGGPDGGSDDDGGVADAGVDAGDGDGGVGEDDVRVTNDNGDSNFPSVTTDGTQRAVAWVDNRDGNNEIYFARLQADGSVDGAEIRVTNNDADSGGPSLVWTGSEYGLAWHDSRDGNPEIYFVRLNAAGAVQGVPIRVSNAADLSLFPSLVFNDNGFGVAWEDNRDGAFEIYMSTLDTAGAAVADELRLTNAGTSIAASLTWTGAEYGLAWQDSSIGNDDEIFFARVDTDAAIVGASVRVTNAAGRSGIPSLTYNGDGYGVAWEDARNNLLSIYFVRLTSTGAPLGSELLLTDIGLFARSADVLWTGSDYAVAWTDDRTGNTEVHFASVTAAGSLSGEIAQISTGGNAQEPDLTILGTTLTAVWYDMRDGNNEIYLQSPVP